MGEADEVDEAEQRAAIRERLRAMMEAAAGSDPEITRQWLADLKRRAGVQDDTP